MSRISLRTLARQDEIGQILAELGITAEEVATALQWRGIRGVRNAMRSLNPVIQYLVRSLPREARTLEIVAGNTLRVTYFDGRGQHDILLPDAVMSFLTGFHRGNYPELEMNRPA